MLLINLNDNPLSLAIGQNNIKIVKHLLEFSNIDVNSKYTLLSLGKKTENDECLLDINRYTPLQIAIITNQIEIIKCLMENKDIDVNFKCAYLKEAAISNPPVEKTALHISIENKNSEIIKLLMTNNSIDLNIKDNDGKTPLELANDDDIKNMIINSHK